MYHRCQFVRPGERVYQISVSKLPRCYLGRSPCPCWTTGVDSLLRSLLGSLGLRRTREHGSKSPTTGAPEFAETAHLVPCESKICSWSSKGSAFLLSTEGSNPPSVKRSPVSRGERTPPWSPAETPETTGRRKKRWHPEPLLLASLLRHIAC